jgi:RNA polymerase sigma-70 factor (ECF subfamily)
MTLETFKNAVLPLKHKLYRYANSILGDSEQARDVVQDTFLRLWEKRGDAVAFRSLEAWCMTVARNLALDRLRKGRQQLNHINNINGPAFDHHSPLRSTESDDDWTWIRRILKNMPQKQAEVLRLREIEGYTYQEIQEITGLGLSDIKVSIHRGRKHLKIKLEELYQYGLEKSRRTH